MGPKARERWGKGIASIPSGLVTTGLILGVLSWIDGDPAVSTVSGLTIIVFGGLGLYYGIRGIVRRRRRIGIKEYLQGHEATVRSALGMLNVDGAGQVPISDDAPMFPCVCCGYVTLTEEPGSYEICPICFWEDDGIQLAMPDMGGGANHVSLVEAQTNYQNLGASEPRVSRFVRAATNEDKREPGWRPIDNKLDYFEAERDTEWPADPTVLYWWRPSSRVSRRTELG